MPYPTDALHGRTILVAEDEYYLADYIVSAIQSAGGAVQGPFPSAEQALARLSDPTDPPDAATLNVNLLDGPSYPVADALAEARIPFVFASANNSATLPARFALSPHLSKPFAAYQVVQALLALIDGEPASV